MVDARSLTIAGLFLTLVVGVVLSAPLSLFLLWLYRRAVLRGMSLPAGAPAATLPAVAPAPPSQPLRITTLSKMLQPLATGDNGRLGQAVAQSLRCRALAYVAAGLAYAMLITGAWSALVPRVTFLGFLSSTFFFSWPVVLALAHLWALGWKDRLILVGIYWVVYALVGISPLVPGSPMDPGLWLEGWLRQNGLPTLVLVAFLTRRVRAVGPLVLVFMTTAVAGALLVGGLLSASNDWLQRALLPGLTYVQVILFGEHARSLRMLLSAGVCFFAPYAVGFAVLAILGWKLLRLIGRLYQQKHMSDQSLTLDAMWLMFAAVTSIGLTVDDLKWVALGPAAFILYKLVLRGVWACFARPAAVGVKRTVLLMLRVFSLGPRSLRLFDALAKHWLRAGPIVLIAGPDLVTGIVEPPEFLDFVGGRMSRRFVQGKDDLEQRLAELDTLPDPDGRYRVNEFFCRADTWQMTMRQLAARSDTVCMDLRSFSPSNQGCQYELGQLLNIVPLPQVLIIVDATTDLAFLEASLQDLWRSVPADSPNRSLQDPEIRLYRVHSGTGAEVRKLLSLLYEQVRPTADFATVSTAS